MTRPVTARLLLALLAGALASGCASSSSVGSQNVLDFKDRVQHGLGSEAPSATPKHRADKPSGALTVPTQQPKQSTQPTATQAAEPKQQNVSLVISINSDTSAAGSQFTPSQARVYSGSVVEWKNHDSKARSVVADHGEFKSPLIPPGGVFRYTADKVGTFSYHDGTRPYAVASLEVLKG